MQGGIFDAGAAINNSLGSVYDGHVGTGGMMLPPLAAQTQAQTQGQVNGAGDAGLGAFGMGGVVRLLRQFWINRSVSKSKLYCSD